MVNGFPAISYYDATNGGLKYAAADDADGTSWSTVGTIDAAGDTGRFTSLAVVNGNPAISYFDDTNNDLKFVRADSPTAVALQSVSASNHTARLSWLLFTLLLALGSLWAWRRQAVGP